jgi:hypothetical protein
MIDLDAVTRAARVVATHAVVLLAGVLIGSAGMPHLRWQVRQAQAHAERASDLTVECVALATAQRRQFDALLADLYAARVPDARLAGGGQ